MQFLPSSWAAYGVDANGDGHRNPYDAEDAICAAANYMRAAGARSDLRGAIFAYNPADWYVDMVMSLAREYAGIIAVDPLPRAKRLARDWAITLARISREHEVDWALVLAVLRGRGEHGRTPGSLDEIRSVARGIRNTGERSARRRLASSVRVLPSVRRSVEPEVMVLARYNRAVGLAGLIEGLNSVRNRLERRVLDSNRLSIYSGGRQDIVAGRVDVRILILLLYLAERYEDVTVSSLITGHGYYARPGVPSAHSFGQAVDITAFDGTPVLGNQKRGGPTEPAVRDILRLPKELQPEQLISLFDFGGPSFAAADHHDHIHVGY